MDPLNVSMIAGTIFVLFCLVFGLMAYAGTLANRLEAVEQRQRQSKTLVANPADCGTYYGTCANCGKPIIGESPTWTGPGLDGRLSPLHVGCWDGYYRECAGT